MKTRILVIVVTVLLALGLVAISIVAAQGGGDDGPDDEALREADKAQAAEANPAVEERTFTYSGPTVVTAPLFVGVDDPALFTYLIDPGTGTSYPQFTGGEVWGATYDPANDRIFFSDGTMLYEWPVGAGSPTLLGTIVSSNTAASLSMLGLAFDGGQLYGSRGIGTAGDPEGLYAINLTTLQASLVTTYPIGSDAVDMGGLDFHPTTGVLYGVNDDADLRGLVQIDLDGTVTLVAPYPAGEIDVDGLAVGDDNRAYMVIDNPGDIYVFDFGTMTYTTPITAPWATSEVFAGGAWLYEPSGAAISLTKTVGTDPNSCAATNAISVAPGAEVTYCYEVANTGVVTLTLHDLVDSELGVIQSGFPYTLTPGASTFLTESTTIVTNTANVATWTAYNPGPSDVAAATDTASVMVIPEPDIMLYLPIIFNGSASAAVPDLALPVGLMLLLPGAAGLGLLTTWLKRKKSNED